MEHTIRGWDLRAMYLVFYSRDDYLWNQARVNYDNWDSLALKTLKCYTVPL